MTADAAPATRRASKARPVRFVIVERHPLVVEALVSRIRLVLPDAVIAYAGSSSREAVQCAAEQGCDCAIVDLEAADGSVVLDSVSTRAMLGVPTVALTERAASEHLESYRVAGVRGYVDKRADASNVCEAITAVLDGRTWLASEPVTMRLTRPTVMLSDQERRALVLYASGMTQAMVARRMGIASSTVKHYLDRVREKFQAAGLPARTKLELHTRARADGLFA